MRRKIKFILVGSNFILLLFLVINMVYAVPIEWWEKATSWYKNGTSGIGLPAGILDGISSMVEIIGTGVIAIATVVIGIKYIFGTAMGKANAKESLMNLIVACIFFFGWSSISGLLITGNSNGIGVVNGKTGLVFFNGDLKASFSSVFTMISYVGKIIAIIIIAILGVKFIYSGADAKAQLKQKSPIIIIGIVLIFCSTNFLGILAKIINQIL